MFEMLFDRTARNVQGIGATDSASFQESSANVGDTIHADFSWAGALFNPVGGFANMVIQDPDGNNCSGYADVTHSAGSRTLSCTTDKIGTWTARISVWNGFMWIEATDTIIVNTSVVDTLTEAVTCGWVDGYQDHGAKVTEFDIDETVYAYIEIHGDDLYGKTVRHEWWYNGVKRWEWTKTCGSHYTGWSTWTWWDIGLVYGAGSGYVKVYLDNAYMGKTNDYSIIGGEGDAGIVGITAPDYFTPGVEFEVDTQVKNNGSGDTIFTRLTNAGTSKVLEERSVEIGGNGTRTFTFPIILAQTTDFYGLVEAGHLE